VVGWNDDGAPAFLSLSAGRQSMDPKHNRDQNRPKEQNQESQQNKSNAGHKQQQGQRSDHQTEQKKRSGLS
jgi:hypothetical protein